MNIIDKAKQLGLDIGDGTTRTENLKYIANQLGVDDLDSLNETLDEMLQENISTDTIETLDSEEIPQKQRFGEKEYNAARNKEGIYDKRYYANKNKELDDKVKSAEAEKAKDKKEVTKKNEKGERVPTQVNKNVFDRTKDNISLMNAKKNKFQNRINSVKSKAYQASRMIDEPEEVIKEKAGDAAKGLARKAGNTIANVGKQAVKTSINSIKSFFLTLPPQVRLVGALTIIIFIIMFILIIVTYFSTGNNEVYGLYGYDYVAPKCTEITIEGGDYAGVYDLEEYIAGVTYGEFGVFIGNERHEAAKAGSIAARSFVQANVGDDCTVISSEAFQVYRTPSEGAIEVANETRGLVLTDSSGNIKSTQYDAFCTDSPQDDPDNYIVCQKNQLVPREWVDNESGIAASWKTGERNGAHGNGMSAWGAAYLAEQGYTFEEILEYYYDNMELRSLYKSYGYTGEYPIDPNNELYSNLAFLVDESLTDFLTVRGTNVEDFNTFLTDKISEAGVGTREGVVSAAVSLIGSLAELGVKLNYQWGGKYYWTGVNPNWGTQGNTDCNHYASVGYDINTCTTNYKWVSFDCSGFVNWALVNGMQDISVSTQYTDTTGGISLSSTGAVCKPGGTLVSEGHIVLVVGIDDENKKYIVAESTGSRLATGYGGVKLSYYDYDESGYVCKNLDELYGE